MFSQIKLESNVVLEVSNRDSSAQVRISYLLDPHELDRGQVAIAGNVDFFEISLKVISSLHKNSFHVLQRLLLLLANNLIPCGYAYL
jgi:hypothetical protein